MKTRKRRQDPDAEYNVWQPATDMMSALVYVLLLIIALLGLYLLNDYTDYEEPSSSSEEAASSGWYDDHGGWHYGGADDDPGDGKYDQQIIQTGGGGGGYDEDGVKAAVFAELIDEETERRIQEAGVRFELYRTDTAHLINGSLQTLNTYYPEKISYREYETTGEGTFYLPEKIWQGSYYFHQLSEPEGYDAAADTYYDVDRMYDWPEPYIVQIRVAPCKNIIRLQMNDAETRQPVGGGTFRVIAAEDIITKDGTVRYTQGQQVDAITCDENGYGESVELYLGKYTVQQQSSPNYYTTMQQDLDAKVEKKNGSDPELHKIETEKTKILLNVTDELTSSALEGAVFTVTNRRTGTTQTVATDGSGQIRLTDLDKSTTYLIREQQAPGSYRPDDTDHTVTLDVQLRILLHGGPAGIHLCRGYGAAQQYGGRTALPVQRAGSADPELDVQRFRPAVHRSDRGQLLCGTRQGRSRKCPEISVHCTGYGKYAELERAGVYTAQCGGSGCSGCGRRWCGLAAGVPVGHPCPPPQGAESCYGSGRDPRPKRK